MGKALAPPNVLETGRERLKSNSKTEEENSRLPHNHHKPQEDHAAHRPAGHSFDPVSETRARGPDGRRSSAAVVLLLHPSCCSHFFFFDKTKSGGRPSAGQGKLDWGAHRLQRYVSVLVVFAKICLQLPFVLFTSGIVSRRLSLPSPSPKSTITAQPARPARGLAAKLILSLFPVVYSSPDTSTRSGYPVLPMALKDQTMMVAIGKHPSPSHEGVKVLNFDESKFPEIRFLSLTSPTLSSDAPHDWIRYVACALQGVRRQYSGIIDEQKLNGLVLVVHGTVPPAAGLSSSSALVVASALAFCWATGKGDIRKATLAALCVECERLVGTAGGGMDQTVSCLAEPGNALFIEFEPRLKATAVPLPPGVVVVVADCGVTSEKAVSATTHFNKRVVECQVATWVLATHTDMDDWSSCETLHELEQQFGGPLGEMLHFLPPGEVPVRQLQNSMCRGDFFPPFPDSYSTVAELVVAHSTSFNVRDRAVHVLNEADRVQRFAALCRTEATTASCARALGVLMNNSHTSCRDLYECSCPELDSLVAVCQTAPGCFGARLTGAGWGGMCVALCEEEKVDEFMADVKERFYKRNGKSDNGEAPIMFVTRPGGGAGVVWEGELGE